MADENLNDVKPAKAPKNAAPLAPPADETPKEHALDGILRNVEDANTVHAGVKTLVEKLADEFASPDLQERAGAFADAVKANAADAGHEAPLKAPSGPGMTEDELDAIHHKAPHNDAAARAVEAGMDIKTANIMTAPGANI